MRKFWCLALLMLAAIGGAMVATKDAEARDTGSQWMLISLADNNVTMGQEFHFRVSWLNEGVGPAETFSLVVEYYIDDAWTFETALDIPVQSSGSGYLDKHLTIPVVGTVGNYSARIRGIMYCATSVTDDDPPQFTWDGGTYSNEYYFNANRN